MAHIVVVDDEPDLVEACRMILELAGHRVDAILSGEGALALARRVRPDLVLIDWVMSGVEDGGQVLAALRRDEDLRRIPVVVMSALVDGAYRAAQSGADGFLAKPFGAEELVAAVSPLLAPSPRRGG